MSFFSVREVWIVAQDKQSEAVLGWFVCSALQFIPHEPRKKRHSFLIFTMFPTKTLSKILREKLLIQNPRSNGHLTSFDVFITAHVIRPNRPTFCWLCSSEIELKNFSRVQRSKYDTIVNIWEWCMCIMTIHSSVRKIIQYFMIV